MLLDGTSSNQSIHQHQPHSPNSYRHQQPSGLPISSSTSSFSPSEQSSFHSPSLRRAVGTERTTSTTTTSPTSSLNMNNAQASTSKLPTTTFTPSIEKLRPIPPFQGNKSNQNQALQNGLHLTNNSNPSPASPSSHLAMPTTAADLMREGPRDFTVIKDVGDGSFGTVCLADWKSPLPSGTVLSPMQHPTTRPEYVGKRLVAIKKMKKPFPNWAECMKLKELKVSPRQIELRSKGG